MKPITRQELASRSKDELHALLRTLFNQLATSAPTSAERRDAHLAIDAVRAELGRRPQGLRP